MNKIVEKDFFLPLIVFFVVIGFFVGSYLYASSVSNSYKESFQKDLLIEKRGEAFFLKEVEGFLEIQLFPRVYESVAFQRIISSLKEVRRRKQKYYTTILFFNKQYFVFNLMQSILILFATVTGLVIGKFGWEKVYRSVLYTAFLCAGCIAFVKVLTSFMNIERNIKTNEEGYHRITEIEHRVLTYLSTGMKSENENIDAVKYVHYLDRIISQSHKMGFDINEIPEEKLEINQPSN